jgi:hypothetical protein
MASTEMGVLDNEIEEVSFNEIEIMPDEQGIEPSATETVAVGDPISESIQIAPTVSELGQEDSPTLFIHLGDDIIIESITYGRTIGTVYYRSLEMIHVKPDGVSNDVHRFAVEQTENGEEHFSEEDGVSAIYILKKREFESFVEQQDIRINQTIDTFNQERKPYKTYKVIGVDTENDKITIQDPNEEKSEELEFGFIGIPAEKHREFVVLRVRPMVFSDEPSSDEAKLLEEQNQDQPPIEEQEESDLAELEDLGIEEVGEIEVVRSKVYTEAAAYEQRIPDNIQRIDALNDFLSSLDPSLQNDPYALRSVRTLVETLFYLKQSTISYEKSGEIQGAKALSASTLVDLIQRAAVPLGRPVLNISKKEYKVDDFDEKSDAQNIQFVDFEWELKQMKDKISTLVSGSIKGDSKGKIVTEWHDQRTFLSQYASPWRHLSVDEPLWKASTDSDFFRTNPPDSEQASLPGYIASHDIKSPPIFHKVPFGIERALTTTYRKGAERQKVALLEEEKASLNSYLLFPIRAAPYLGSTRSHQLAVDSGRSQLPPKTMKTILKELGDPTEMGATSNDIVLLHTAGQTLGNIPLVDYVRGMTFSSLGLGDTFAVLEQYGMEDMELNQELTEVLLEKIKASQSQLLSSLGGLRDAMVTAEVKEGEPNPLLENPAFLEEVQRQPILAKVLQDYEEKNVSLSSSDLGKVIHLMKAHPNYFQIAAGKNALLMGKAFIDANRSIYLSQRSIEQQIDYNREHSGTRPRKNPCRHVADLVSLRKLRDDSERFHELTRFAIRYQGARDQNWINCNVCSEHLLCVHERLQLQAYLNPKEKDTIEKEIILMFSGGQFQGNYICRNCGQTIRELGFDNNLEFDDNGKPKSGRAVLVDKDMELDKLINNLLDEDAGGAPTTLSMEKELDLGESETVIYHIVREISERVGILLDKQGYRNVIRGAKSWIDKFPDRKTYAKKQEKSKGRMPDYEIATSRDIINASAVYLLIEIQTKIPAYVVRYALKGCKSPGFEGYPLDSNESNQQGIQYIACAISSIRKKEKPWTLAYQAIPDDKVRQDGISLSITRIIKDIIGNDMIQAQLEEKRRYLLHVLGTSSMGDESRTKDSIPASFLPAQIILTPEEAAKHVISREVVEAVGNERARAGLVALWIRQAHAIAEKSAHLVRGSAFSETTCCINPIQEPGSYWKSMGELPEIHKRTLMPYRQGQSLLTEFIPREAAAGVTEPNKDLYFRLFLKCCFTGPRIGYSHQPGVTHQCLWCGFQFPTDPTIMDTDKEGKAALGEVDTNTAKFTELLDTIHNVNRVEPIHLREISTVRKCMDELIAIKPVPLDDWERLIALTTDQFMKLNHPGANADDFALAAGELSNASSDARVNVERRLSSEKLHRILEGIARLSWVDFFKVLQTYFIIPFQRIFYNFSPESFKIPVEMVMSLSETHVEKDLQPVLEKELAFLTSNKGLISGDQIQFAKLKLEDYLAQVSALLPSLNHIRPSVIPGGDTSLLYIRQAFLYGPLSMLLDSSRVPTSIGYQSTVDAMMDRSVEFLLRMVSSSLNKYTREYLSYDTKEIKNLIAISEEKERVNVLREYRALSDEERKMERMNQMLGLGKWAVGGTKLIYAYDKDYYDLERQKRLDAGIMDFPGQSVNDMDGEEGGEYDELGFRQYGDDDEYERDGGYDHNQHGDDDNE